MSKNENSFYILQVSDFHISEDSKESAKQALKALTEKLKKMKICISYLIHTGDVINSKDIGETINNKSNISEISDDEYDNLQEEIYRKRFEIARNIITEFIKDLDVLRNNIVICCGNHDKIRYRNKNKNSFTLFQNFLESVCNHSDLTALYDLEDLNVLVLNTNISDDKKITCVDCKELKNTLKLPSQREEQTNWFYTYEKKNKLLPKNKKVNIIVAHQPLYDICEHIRLPYGSETQATDFLSALQDFINGNGIYLCGDKHTSSIAASYIHDIPHFFCGHPFVFEENKLPSCCTCEDSSESMNVKIDYNLIEVMNGKIGQVRKLHLFKTQNEEWECQIHPIDAVVLSLYENSKNYIVKNSFDLLAIQHGIRYRTWKNLSWRNLFKRLEDFGIKPNSLEKISEFYSLFCLMKDNTGKVVEWNKENNIFNNLCNTVTNLMNNNSSLGTENIINIRGDYSSGKSTFLGIFYIYLLYKYSYGEINYIPAYFNMENDDILNKIQDGSTYASSVKQIFSFFVERIESIARIEHTSVCYIIDGLDEQDIWSESSQDSIGRVTLDILAETNNSKYIMSFCQNKLARFKNTMPAMKYYEKSYVMYFNLVSVKEKNDEKSNFVKFVQYIVDWNQENEKKESIDASQNLKKESFEPKECSTIRKLRRLYINPGFIYHNYWYLKECKPEDTINTVYMRYIDQQHQICLNTLDYHFVHYAPAMAYLFTYEGYTYERFKSISPGSTFYWEKKILEYSSKIYRTFIFIKKHKDAREYLIALHYNRELRYFAENPKIDIPENSIINKLIPRNISIIIKKLWRNDQNKFIIVCRNLMEKRKQINSKPVNNCTLSMLIYILAYLDKIPAYIRDEIKKLLLDLENLKNESSEIIKQSKEHYLDPWRIFGNNSEKMEKFIDLSFLHSQKILNAINSNNSASLVRELLNSPNFVLYNRQYMMWYYGDLTIYGENRINNLVPGENIINKGIDFYKCFYTLYHKIYAYFDDGYPYLYPLLEFDLFTICDLAYSRQLYKEDINKENFFYSEDKKEKAIHDKIKSLLKKYIHYCDNKNNQNKENGNLDEEKDITINFDNRSDTMNESFKKITDHLEGLGIDSDKRFIYYFFKIVSQLF